VIARGRPTRRFGADFHNDRHIHVTNGANLADWTWCLVCLIADGMLTNFYKT